MKPSKPGVRSNVKNKKLRSRRNCRADATYKRVQALECMHVFHKKCIMNYSQVSGQEWRRACPMHCFRDPVVVEDAMTVVEEVSNGVLPASDDVLALADQVSD